jgi:hypothetical protein
VTITPTPDRSEDDHTHQPRGVRAGDGKHYHRDRARNAAGQQESQTDKARQHDRAGDDTDRSTGYVRGLQTSTT